MHVNRLKDAHWQLAGGQDERDWEVSTRFAVNGVASRLPGELESGPIENGAGVPLDAQSADRGATGPSQEGSEVKGVWL